MQALSAAESIRLIQAAAGSALYVPVVLALATGMRRGEVCALKWEDTVLKRGAVTIRRSLQETQAGLAFKATKSKKG